MKTPKPPARPATTEDNLLAEDFHQEYHELPEAFDDDLQLFEDTRSPLPNRGLIAPAGHMTIIGHRPFGAVVDHWSRDKHDVYTYITNETLRNLKLEGAAYVPNDTPTVTKMFRCKSKGCTRIQCARYTRIKLSSAITRVVRAKGPWSLMLTIPRLTDEELKKAYKIAQDVAQHLQDTIEGVTCWGVIATAEYHSSGITEDSAQKAISRGERTQYPYHLHVIVPVALAPQTVAADVTTEANVFLRSRADKAIYKGNLPGSLPMKNPAQEIATIAAGEKKDSAPYASILHIDELADQLGRDDYLYDYFTKGLVSPLSSQRSDEDNSAKNVLAGIKRHKEINNRLSRKTIWYLASTLQKGRTSFFHIAPFQDDPEGTIKKKRDKYRMLVSDNNARRKQYFKVEVSYEGIEAEAEVTPADFTQYPHLSVHEARDVIVEEKRGFLLEQCMAAHEA
jgi:hypothetical protein